MKRTVCKTCEGRGRHGDNIVAFKCFECNGTGMVKGSFICKRGVLNEYECSDCLKAGVAHEIKKDVPCGQTDRSSCWGPGIPTTIHLCTGCGKSSAPWVSADIVGGGW